MLDLFWLVPLLPFLGFLINGISGKRLSEKAVAGIACTGVLASFVIAASVFAGMKSGSIQAPVTIRLFDFITFGHGTLSFSLLVDQLSILMTLIITGVGFLIHVYSAGYMHNDKGYVRFFAYLNLFVFFMLLLVLGDNYILMFAGWEGVGFCSYLLIGFWFKNHEYNNAARKAFVMNRIGDLGFLAGLFLIFMKFGSLNYADVLYPETISQGYVSGDPMIMAITLLLFIGATGKSAQIPLFTWLPDAMAGPTPVSALIHAATMVTAGIYMITRSSILYYLAPFTLEIIAVIGVSTALLGALIALTQNDIKKVLAYSTVSQLGYMFAALGAGAYTSGMFHLTTHAFFKALLFLGAGSVIHALNGEQDLRNMGGLRKKLPFTYMIFLVGALAISGLPPFSGFFSKDEILVAAYAHSVPLFAVLALTSLLTIFYNFRLFFMAFNGSYRGDKHAFDHAHEAPRSMAVPLGVLAVLSVAGGFLNIPELFGGGQGFAGFLAPALFHPPAESAHAVSHSFEYTLIGISAAAVLILILVTKKKYTLHEPVTTAPSGFFYRLSLNKFYVDEIYDTVIGKPLRMISGGLHALAEVLLIDGLVNAAGRIVILLSSLFRLIQTGKTGTYLFIMVLGAIMILALHRLL